MARKSIGPPMAEQGNQTVLDPLVEDFVEEDDFVPAVVRSSKSKQASIAGTFEEALNRTPLVIGPYLNGHCPNGTALFRLLTLIGRTGEVDGDTETLLCQNRKLVEAGLAWLKSKVPNGLEPVTTGRHVGADRYRPAFNETEFEFTEIPAGSMAICPVARDGNTHGVLDMRTNGDAR